MFYSSREKGFSLLELTVVLAIVGAVSAGALLSYSELRVHSKWTESDAKLVVVKAALLKFAQVNKYLPCPDVVGLGDDSRTIVKGHIPAIPAIPATPAVPKTATSPTIPAIPSQGAQPAIPNIPVSVCTADSGTVPYAVLGLAKASVQDAWGNLFYYAVDKGATDADKMLNCPTASACFFNRDDKPILPAGKVFPGSVLPAFDFTTEPLKGALGADNLRICASDACSKVEAEGLLAVLVAFNENGKVTSGLDSSEAENRDGDQNFVNAQYSESPYYDDLLLGIAANEIKTPREVESFEVVVTPPTGGPIVKTGENVENAGDTAFVGAVGDNNAYSDNVSVDRHTQSIEFGSDNANKTVVLTLDTMGQGTWDQGGSYTEDRAYIQVNGTTEETLAYDKNNNTLGATTADGDLVGEVWNSVDSRWDKTYSQSREYIVTTDADGNVLLDFAVATTGTDESVSFTNIVLVLYDTPPQIPDFPSVNPISGIDQTGRFQ